MVKTGFSDHFRLDQTWFLSQRSKLSQIYVQRTRLTVCECVMVAVGESELARVSQVTGMWKLRLQLRYVNAPPSAACPCALEIIWDQRRDILGHYKVAELNTLLSVSCRLHVHQQVCEAKGGLDTEWNIVRTKELDQHSWAASCSFTSLSVA